MHMFDSRRPRAAGGRPQFLGTINAVLPGLIAFPSETIINGVPWVSIMVIVPTSWNGFSPKWKKVPKEFLKDLLDEYTLDPEGTLVKYWGLDPAILQSIRPEKSTFTSRPKINISLEDLDL